MGIQDLQEYIENECEQACKPVDLMEIGRLKGLSKRKRNKHPGSGQLRLVVDAESCLDRLYGGFYSDWACGGQWNRMFSFLSSLIQNCQSSNIELVVFFDGALETQRMKEWMEKQTGDKKKVNQVLKHIYNKATPPPKIWWVPPVCLRVCLRMALRQFGVAVACSMDDHHQEVIAYCRENNFNGLLAHNSDYAIFDPPRYFSSHHLKLKYGGALETKEYIMDEVAKALNLHPERFCIFAALLGNHILPEADLKEFFDVICVRRKETKDIITAVVAFVRDLSTVDDLDVLGKQIFRSGDKTVADKVTQFKQSVQYYLNGTQEGFLKYRPKIQVSTHVKQPGSYPGKPQRGKSEVQSKEKPSTAEKEEAEEKVEAVETVAETVEPADEKGEEADDEADKDDDDKDLKADKVYTEGESGYAQPQSGSGQLMAPEIVIDPPSTSALESDVEAALGSPKEEEKESEGKEKASTETTSEKLAPEEGSTSATLRDEDSSAEADGEIAAASSSTSSNKLDLHKLSSVSSSSSSSSGSSPSRLSPDTAWTMKIKTTQQVQSKTSSRSNGEKSGQILPEIMRVASERHQKGLMSPWIYQALSQCEIKISVSLEDDNNHELPSCVELYRPIRQNIYAIIFDLGKKKAATKSSHNGAEKGGADKQVIIKEWTVPKGGANNRQQSPEPVLAEPLDWKVPTIRRLWLGQAVEDKNRRLRAFLSCMRSDAPLILNTTYVPQHLLIMGCVLRYMVSYKEKRVLRKHELDAFLAAAVSPLLNDVHTMQEMKLPMMNTRGVHLAALFMHGVETAIFANDACGAPIPWMMCCPWHFFDGKLFHFKLLKANNSTPLIDICDGQVEQVMQVERMRQAVLEGIKVDLLFAKPTLPVMPSQCGPPGGVYSPLMSFRPAGAPPLSAPPHPGGQPMGGGRGIGRGRGLLGRSPVDSRGGQLEIAGVVVGNWGANTQSQARPGSRGGRHEVPPHIMSVGPRRGAGRGMMFHPAHMMRGRGGMPRGMPGGGHRTQIPAQHFYGGGGHRGPGKKQHSKGRGRGGHGQQQDPSKVTLEQRTHVRGGSGRGRGCTVEYPADSSSDSVVSVSQLIKQQLEQENCVLGDGGGGDHQLDGGDAYLNSEEDRYADADVDLDEQPDVEDLPNEEEEKDLPNGEKDKNSPAEDGKEFDEISISDVMIGAEVGRIREDTNVSLTATE